MESGSPTRPKSQALYSDWRIVLTQVLWYNQPTYGRRGEIDYNLEGGVYPTMDGCWWMIDRLIMINHLMGKRQLREQNTQDITTRKRKSWIKLYQPNVVKPRIPFSKEAYVLCSIVDRYDDNIIMPIVVSKPIKSTSWWWLLFQVWCLGARDARSPQSTVCIREWTGTWRGSRVIR